MRSYPLIRKSHSLIDVLKHIVKMIKNRGKVPKFQQLVIPKTNNFCEVLFKSVFSENITSNVEELPKSPEDLIKLVEKFNITGKGGANFPTYKKLEAFNNSDKLSRVLIINAAECDPGLFHDQWIALNLHSEVSKIANLIKELFNVDKIFLAAKFDLAENLWPGIDYVQLPERYPVGAEKLLVKVILGKDPMSYKYPVNEGVLVQNIQTLYSIYNAVFNPENVKQHLLTYRDLKNKKSYVVLTSNGSAIGDICSGNDIYIGGGIMQAKEAKADDIIDSSVNFIASGKAPEFKDDACKGCMQCVSHCPLGLDVNLVLKDEMDTQQGQRCVKCGSCSYICPAGIDLCSKVKELSA